MREFRHRRLGAAVIAACAALVAGRSLAAAERVDATVKPGDDFYAYANGPWLKATQLPEGAASIDTTALLRAENARRVRGLIEAAAAGGASRPAADVKKLGDYYASRLDTAAVEDKGFAPIAQDLAAIAGIADRHALAAYLGRTVQLDDGGDVAPESLWAIWVHQGFHDGHRYAVHVLQGGLGLAEPADYLDPASDHVSRRALYRTHVAKVLQAAGLDHPEARAERILALETAIARTHASRADTDDVVKTDNSWRLADFAAKAPGLDWDAYFAAAGLKPATTFVVWQPQAVIGGAKLVGDQPLEAWKDYLAFHRIEHYAAVLPKAVADEDRSFGITAPTPIAATEAVFGDTVGRLYLERYFSPQAKAAAVAMVDNIRAAFRPWLAAQAWMSPETRAKAQAKLAGLRVGLGYPESWIDYSALTVVRGDALGNLRRAEAFAYRRELAKLDRPVDPDEWGGGLHPQMVGAILNISPNSMQFAASLLQPPYFDAAGDAASNYGSAGAGIAHEISHSFDDVGEQYDGEGRLAPWKTDADKENYKTATASLVAQLDRCCPAPDACTHGRQVLGESAADLVGLELAHDAYLHALGGRPDVVKDGLTGEQRFFVAFAQRWRRLQTDAALRRQIASDIHAPPMCRSDLVRNSDAWVRAFDVKPGDKLYLAPAERWK